MSHDHFICDQSVNCQEYCTGTLPHYFCNDQYCWDTDGGCTSVPACSIWGHCACECHRGAVCVCGYTWKMPDTEGSSGQFDEYRHKPIKEITGHFDEPQP